MTSVLEARALEAWYGRRRIVAPCDLHIARGEIFGLYGPNGAGKSTLLQALAHLHPHARGELAFDGKIVGRELSAREFRRRSAVVFQDCLLLRGTVLDNVALGLKLRGLDALERERRARRWLERLRIPHLAARRAHGLSGGEAQRVSLARAFVLDPDVIFLDEPFSALDAPTRDALVDDLGGILGENGTTALFVSHDPDELRDLCGRCLILDQGSVLQSGPVREVFDEPQTRRVAEIVGADNLITARVMSLEGQFTCLDWDGESLRVPGVAAAPGAEVTFTLQPQAIELLLPPVTVPSGAIAGTIARARTRAREALVSVRLRNGRVLRVVAPGHNLVVGANAFLVLRPDALWRFEHERSAPLPSVAVRGGAQGARG